MLTVLKYLGKLSALRCQNAQVVQKVVFAKVHQTVVFLCLRANADVFKNKGGLKTILTVQMGFLRVLGAV